MLKLNQTHNIEKRRASRLSMNKQKQSGFTIVELLIVVVVIAILAAITIVAYNGIQNRAKESAVQSEVSQLVRKLETTKLTTTEQAYPATLAAANIQSTSGNTVNYYVNTTTNKYCLEASNGTIYASSLGVGQPVTNKPCSQNGLVGWWTMNNTVADQSGIGNNGTATNLTTITGQNAASSAYLYNGTDSILTVPYNNSLQPEALTMSLWVRPTNWATTAATVFISMRSGNSGFFFHRLGSSQTINIDVAGSSTRWNTQYSPPLDQWTLITMVLNPTIGRYFYVNGQLQNSTSAHPNNIVTTSSELSIGGENGYGYLFNGRIDDVRMFNRALPADEIQKIFTDGAV